MVGISGPCPDFQVFVSIQLTGNKLRAQLKNSNSGIEPNRPEENFAPYSSPAIKINDGSKTTYVMESSRIAASLEALSPTNSLHLDSDILPRVQELIPKIMGPLRPEWMPKIPRNVLGPESAEYFQRTRAERVGMSLDEFDKKGPGAGEEAWELARDGIEKMASVLKENEGPFFMGSTGA
jgi:hypothetical protein